ncbi:beta family protein [Curvivirga aplysinae]|uniref:beta family protein n=1 Tax=Curvivirga aplysinae TaxID=2529852 RepID=UPI0012BCE2B3|nr:hypothetical protein [Curvivirga aplysinae]MTI09251.1 hypothetical protein [Curvivirga aplysinae]
MTDFFNFQYIPNIGLKPAEMLAMKELPNSTLDRMLPVFCLKPWANSKHLVSSVDRINMSVGERPWIADIARKIKEPKTERPVHDELRQLLDPRDGYSNWVEFVRELPNAIPCIQLGNDRELEGQCESLANIGRGIVLRISESVHISNLPRLIRILNIRPDVSKLVIFDLGYLKPRQYETRAIELVRYVNCVLDELGDRVPIVISNTSFPMQFVDGINETDILDRMIFNEVSKNTGYQRLIYGDWGSSRDLPGGGNGEKIPPRIDYPTQEKWIYVKDTEGDYQTAATSLIRDSGYWDEDLKIWASQMIKSTRLNGNAIHNARMCTAVRINMHLHLQTFYNEGDARFDTDDEWVDI